MSKKKNGNYSFRNNKKTWSAILADNKKYFMPAVFALAVLLTVAIALSANKRIQNKTAAGTESVVASSVEIPELTMEENAHQDVNELIKKYYDASANGDSETISAIYKGLDDTELLKAVAAADYIDGFQNITVYTKPGPKAGSYVAYVYNEVKLYDYEKTIPGLETLYICTDDNGSLYINGDIADSDEIEYLKQVNLQADVIDLNNKVATNYNEMVNSDEALADLLTKMRSGLQVSVGEALASSESTSEAGTEESSEGTTEEEAVEATSEESVQTVTTHTIRATDVVNIRSSDSETADIISKTSKGDEFKQLEALANGWSRIEYKGGVAYVKTEFFEVVSEETTVVENDNKETEEKSNDSSSESSTTSTVKASDVGKMTVSESVRLRKSESTDAEVMAIIYSGSQINVIEQYANGWAKVEFEKKTGYIKSEFLSKE